MWNITQLSATIFFISWDVSWFLVGCLRIPRYSRHFQQAGYDKNQYYQWYRENISERRYILLSFGFFIFGFLTIMVGLALNVLFAENIGGILTAIIFVLLTLSALYCAPRDRDIKQPFSLTGRAVRLLLTACTLEAVPILFSGFVFLHFFDGPFQSGGEIPYGCIVGLFWGLPTLAITVAAGPISYLMTPYSVPLANPINWPHRRRTLKAQGQTSL